MEGSISDEAISLLETTFAQENEGNVLKVEIQPWDGIVAKMQTALASDKECPDLIETGNTQSSIFSSVGAFAQVDDMYDTLGGADLIPSFIEAGTWDGKLYALPLYAGARGVFYRKDLIEAAGLSEPKTLDEFADTVIELGKANPENVPGFSGMYLAAVDQHSANSLFFAGGGEFATMDGGTWVQQLTAPQSISAIKRIQRLFNEGTAYALDSQAAQTAFEKYFNDAKVGVLVATDNVGGKISDELWDADKVGVMAIPGLKEGEIGHSFAGGSNISLPTKSQNPELARKALEIIFAEDFQILVAKDGWVPGNVTYGKEATGRMGPLQAEIVADAKLTPNTPQWGVATSNNLIRDFYTALAQGNEVEATAAEYGQKIEDILNSK
ncbi:extracellular solute-binding protein [Actinomyces respiraculi]|uniref:Extracellular solute-binding protein n=2 Tax=Actinomycetaceae TaxID=2049 RepID=A0A7T0LMX9_9ACTO|nr:extracellular solute-binding protein [Actinomyces respiraculi]